VVGTTKGAALGSCRAHPSADGDDDDDDDDGGVVAGCTVALTTLDCLDGGCNVADLITIVVVVAGAAVVAEIGDAASTMSQCVTMRDPKCAASQ
jgi:hypothetical protein